MEQNKKLKDFKLGSNELNIEEIVKEYASYIYTIIQNASKGELTKEDIEEIQLDTFFVFWKKYKYLDDKTNVKAYLIGIVRNLLKEKKRRFIINENIEYYENNLTDLSDVYEELEEKSKMKLIEEELNNMKDEDRKIFRLYYYSGKKIKEISKELKITEFKVKTKLYRIRQNLRKKLIKGGYRNG